MKKLLLFALGVLTIGSAQAFGPVQAFGQATYHTSDRAASKELAKCARSNPICNGLNCPPSFYHDAACVNKLQKKYPGKISEVSKWSPTSSTHGINTGNPYGI